MTSWAKPADYLIAYKYANASEWRRHLAWLKDQGYPFLAQLEKELARESKGRRSDSANDPVGREDRAGESSEL